MSGSKRPRRLATLKQHTEDSQDPYIYTTSKTKVVNRKPRGTANTQAQKQKRGPKPGQGRPLGPQRQTTNALHAPPADFGARLFSSLKADVASASESQGRRRAYTEIDDLFANDIKNQNEQQ